MKKQERIEYVRRGLEAYGKLNAPSKARTSPEAWIALKLSCTELQARRYIVEASAAPKAIKTAGAKAAKVAPDDVARALGAESPRMPEHSTRQRIAGEKRMQAAIEHLNEARAALDAACRDMCAVIGANPHYRNAGKLSAAVHVLRGEIDQNWETTGRPTYVLDHEPTEDEIEQPHLRGCGKGEST